MEKKAPIVAVCSCEKTMPLDIEALKRAGLSDVREATQMCRAEAGLFKSLLSDNQAIVVGCTQEAPLFEDMAAAEKQSLNLTFANIRETAGWSDEAGHAGPKMAALLAAATIAVPQAALVSLKSEGAVLIYGKDETAIAAATRLKDILDVTVLLTKPGGIAPPRRDDFPVARGTAIGAKGHLGAFEVAVEDFALPTPSSRSEMIFGPGRRATSHCDLILDLSGGGALFPAPELRQGYIRADPANKAAVAEAIFEASQLIGEFDKPRYIRFSESLCAHERSKKTGCTRCLDLCPAGAITPNGNAVAIGAELCMGCGQCAAVCPTGAETYDYPPSSVMLAKLRAMLLAYRAAGGHSPVILFHDEDRGEALIHALARFGRGLPAHVIPFAVNEVTQIGLDAMAAAFAYGASALRFLMPLRPRHSPEALTRNIDYAAHILAGLGYGEGVCATIETDDPDELRATLDRMEVSGAPLPVSEFLPMGAGRSLTKLAISELYRLAPRKPAAIALPRLAPFGSLNVNTEGCTLCLACVGACPTGALSANPERPQLNFSEDLCVQCGLCVTTCPEKVIALDPRLAVPAWNAPARSIKEEEPFHCISCGKAFGVKSTIEKITAKLEGKHWMFSGPNAKRLAVIQMCDDCRVAAAVNEGFDPHGAPQRPALVTSEDYIRLRPKQGSEDE